jgi:hypothetical protein
MTQLVWKYFIEILQISVGKRSTFLGWLRPPTPLMHLASWWFSIVMIAGIA